MSRYIDISDLDIPSDENDYDELVAFADKVAEMVTGIWSIDIVRCKECKWRGEQTESGIPYYWCRLVDVGYEVPIEHYCSYGEREGE